MSKMLIFRNQIKMSINQLVTNLLFSMYGKNFDLKKEGIIEKNFHERRAYESVDGIGATLRLYLKNQRKTKLRQ